MEISTLLDRARGGDERALAHLISRVVDGSPAVIDALRALYRDGGSGHVVGVTGSPGAGKSTLVSAMVTVLLAEGVDRKTAVVAVDPSSPFSGGAILGDRIRMGEHAGRPDVFIRSVANRGHLGGIASTTPAVLAVLDGVGYEEILVETVGVGQAEVEVASAAETTVVVVNPGWGDSIQTSKAGFLEVADVFVVNKADRSETHQTIADLNSMLDTGPHLDWVPPVIPTVAIDGSGVDAVVDAVRSHRQYLDRSGRLAERKARIARHSLVGALRQSVDTAIDRVGADAIDRLVARQSDPWSEAEGIVASR